MALLDFGVDEPNDYSQGLQPLPSNTGLYSLTNNQGSTGLTQDFTGERLQNLNESRGLGSLQERPIDISNESPSTPSTSSQREREYYNLTAPKPQGLSVGQILASALGGPSAGQAIRQQHLQRQLGPTIFQFRTKFNDALKNNDIEGANNLINQFGQYAQLTPESYKEYERASTQYNQITDRINTNTVYLDNIIPHVIPGSSAEQVLKGIYKDRGRFDVKDLMSLTDKLASKGEMQAGYYTVRDAMNQNVLRRESVQQATTPENIQPEFKDAATSLGVPVTAITNLMNKIQNREPLTDNEKLGAQAIDRAVPGLVQRFLTLKHLPIAEARKSSSSPEQQYEEVTGIPSNQVTSPITQSNIPSSQVNQTRIPSSEVNPSTQVPSNQSTQLTPQQKEYQALAHDTAKQYGVPVDLVDRLHRIESNYGANQGPSSKGAYGPMQITNNRENGKPGTADLIALNYNKQYDTNVTADEIMKNPYMNINAGTWYLGKLIKQYNGNTDKALYAYGHGEGAAAKASDKTIANDQYVQQVKGTSQLAQQPSNQPPTPEQDAAYRQSLPQNAPLNTPFNPAQAARQREIQSQAQQMYSTTAATEQAKLDVLPVHFQNKVAVGMDKQGNVTMNPNVTSTEAKEQGLAPLSSPSPELHAITAYTRIKGAVEDLQSYLKNYPAEVQKEWWQTLATAFFDELQKGVMHGVGVGPHLHISIPSGAASLPGREQILQAKADTLVTIMGKELGEEGNALTRGMINGALSNRYSTKSASQAMLESLEASARSIITSFGAAEPKETEGQKSIRASQEVEKKNRNSVRKYQSKSYRSFE